MGGGTQHLISKLLDTMYPVGSIYISEDETSPASIYGGEWERYSNGRVLVGQMDKDKYMDGSNFLGVTFDTVGSTGGSLMDGNSNDYTTLNDEVHKQWPNIGAINNKNFYYNGHGNMRLMSGTAFDSGGRIWFHQASQNGVGNSGYYIGYNSNTRSATNIGYDWSTHMSATMARNAVFVGGRVDTGRVQPYIVVYMWKRLS